MEMEELYHYHKENAEKVEILAPAGSYEIMKAVIQAGADAVYLGGDFFGARAFAGNFHEEELIDAIGYAHQFGRKIYLTVNTLLKESEIDSRLISYLRPYYEAGLDAVIVQDFGVFNLIRKHFPDLHIHASTQMTQTGPEGARILKDAGATRVVTSRELNCQEIKKIHDTCDVEIESFVHGALCYCYSGQCLLSSFNGGRSGNRGRCAQPCRLPYDADGVNHDDRRYILSPKDMCALPVLPDVIESGVYSLKIEGRMKNVTYAAGVTAIYRKYVDRYLKNGRKGYKVDEQDIQDLMDLYNRGAFTEGYYTRDKGAEMLSLSRPNHMGTKALKVLSNVNGRVTCSVLEPIHAHDVFEIDKDHSFSSGEAYRTGDQLVVNLPKKYDLKPGRELYRTRNDALTQWVKDAFTEEHLSVPVDISYVAMTGSNMTLTMYTDSFCATVEGPQVSVAQKQPASEEKIREQLCKLGDTILKADHVEVVLSEDAFVPASQLNELRRETARQLVEQLRRQGSRVYEEPFAEKDCNETEKNLEMKMTKHVLIEKLDSLETILEFQDVSEIYFDYNMIFDCYEDLRRALETLHGTGRKGLLALPHILKTHNEALFKDMIIMAQALPLDGYLVRNLEEMGVLAQLGCDGEIVTDAGLYIANTHSKHQLATFVEHAGLQVKAMTLPYELTVKELAFVTDAQTELIVYGKIPMMLSEQCVRRTFGKCNHKNDQIRIRCQEKNYVVQSNCKFCYTYTSGEELLDIRKAPEIGKDICPGSIRLEFSDESSSRIREILSDDSMLESQSQKESNSTFGHFYRGVE